MAFALQFRQMADPSDKKKGKDLHLRPSIAACRPTSNKACQPTASLLPYRLESQLAISRASASLTIAMMPFIAAV